MIGYEMGFSTHQVLHYYQEFFNHIAQALENVKHGWKIEETLFVSRVLKRTSVLDILKPLDKNLDLPKIQLETFIFIFFNIVFPSCLPY